VVSLNLAHPVDLSCTAMPIKNVTLAVLKA